jgi:hypothetical protein
VPPLWFTLRKQPLPVVQAGRPYSELKVARSDSIVGESYASTIPIVCDELPDPVSPVAGAHEPVAVAPDPDRDVSALIGGGAASGGEGGDERGGERGDDRELPQGGLLRMRRDGTDRKVVSILGSRRPEQQPSFERKGRGTGEGSLGLLPPGSDPVRNLTAPRAAPV